MLVKSAAEDVTSFFFANLPLTVCNKDSMLVSVADEHYSLLLALLSPGSRDTDVQIDMYTCRGLAGHRRLWKAGPRILEAPTDAKDLDETRSMSLSYVLDVARTRGFHILVAEAGTTRCNGVTKD